MIAADAKPELPSEEAIAVARSLEEMVRTIYSNGGQIVDIHASTVAGSGGMQVALDCLIKWPKK